MPYAEKDKKITRASRQNIGYAYIAIWIIGFLVFKFYPLSDGPSIQKPPDHYDLLSYLFKVLLVGIKMTS